MKRHLSVFLFGLVILLMAISPVQDTIASATSVGNSPESMAAHGLSLSNMQIRISSREHTAIFLLYDTVAAKQFYAQLPLQLELSNFRDAQWMFYPPEKLSVTADEAYHDGKKGELSYYQPWGDVFMLYKDFYAGDEMHRLGIGLSGIEDIAEMSGQVFIEKQRAE